MLESKSILKQIQGYITLKNLLIVDITNEDPKLFRPDKEDYWMIASKRDFLFSICAVIFFFLTFWIFYIRLVKGECGGYRTIIVKPNK
jgi:hypothetical protein